MREWPFSGLTLIKIKSLSCASSSTFLCWLCEKKKQSKMRRWKVMTEKWVVEEEVKHRTFLNFSSSSLLQHFIARVYLLSSSKNLEADRTSLSRNILNIFPISSHLIENNMQNRRMRSEKNYEKRDDWRHFNGVELRGPRTVPSTSTTHFFYVSSRLERKKFKLEISMLMTSIVFDFYNA